MLHRQTDSQHSIQVRGASRHSLWSSTHQLTESCHAGHPPNSVDAVTSVFMLWGLNTLRFHLTMYEYLSLSDCSVVGAHLWSLALPSSWTLQSSNALSHQDGYQSRATSVEAECLVFIVVIIVTSIFEGNSKNNVQKPDCGGMTTCQLLPWYVQPFAFNSYSHGVL